MGLWVDCVNIGVNGCRMVFRVMKRSVMTVTLHYTEDHPAPIHANVTRCHYTPLTLRVNLVIYWNWPPRGRWNSQFFIFEGLRRGYLYAEGLSEGGYEGATADLD